MVPRRSRTRALAVEAKIEETPGASSSEPPKFPHDYIPLRKDDAPPVTLQRNPDYRMVTPDILEEVIIDEDMLGKVPQLKYVDHDITDVVKFPELVPHEYLELQIDPLTQQSVLVVQCWARGLECAGLLNLFDIPHFDHSNEVNSCVKILLYCVTWGVHVAG
jgi:hypothetical protein